MDFAEQLRILQAAEGDAALLALATVDLAHPALSEAERARIREALLACAVPHWCDRDFLAALLQTTAEESESLLGRLRTLTVVEPFPARGEHALNVHETARLALREHLRATDTDLWRALSARARAHVARSQEPHARIEALYHLFATDQAAAAGECEALDRELILGGRPEVRSALSLALGELTDAGWLEGAAECEALLPQAEVRNSRGEAAQLEDEARRLVDLTRTVSHPSLVGRSQCLLGDVLQTKGRLDEALPAFREYLDIFQHLTETDPSHAGWKRELAIAHSRVGDIYQVQGRIDEALEAFRKYLNISQKLAGSDPSNAGRQDELAVAHSKVGDIHQERGRLDEALEAFREYLNISQKLAESDPSNSGWQRDLAIAHAKVGDIHQVQGRIDEALEAFRESLAISRKLAESDPSNPGWQRDLAIAHNQLGKGFRMVGREKKAQSSFRLAVEAMELAVAAAPESVSWKNDLENLKR